MVPRQYLIMVMFGNGAIFIVLNDKTVISRPGYTIEFFHLETGRSLSRIDL